MDRTVEIGPARNIPGTAQRERIMRVMALGRLVLRDVGGCLASAAFVAYVMTPFAAWAVLLLWGHAHHPELVGRAVAAGPAVVLHFWLIAAGARVGVVFVLGHYRRARTIMLAIATLLLIATRLPPLPSVGGAAGRPPTTSSKTGGADRGPEGRPLTRF